jgi:hypothetical protein
VLTHIEENPAMRVCLGFDKGDSKNVNCGGKTPGDFHKLIASKHLQPHFPEVSLKALTAAVKNRITK